MFGNPFSPYWWMPQLPVMPQPAIRRVDIGGIYELSTNAVQLTDVSVDYGINPACYNALPCESIVLLKVHADAPAGGESLPIALAIPNNGQSTVSSNGSTVGTSKVPVVDSNDMSLEVPSVWLTSTSERERSGSWSLHPEQRRHRLPAPSR